MKIHLEISSVCCIFLAMLLLAVPFPWILAAAAAAVFHELCHWGMVLLTDGSIQTLEMGTTGALMITGEMPAWKEALCAFAGPAGSFLLFLLSDHFPRIAVCGLMQGMYNLFPIYPLDGGRVLRSFLMMWLSEKTAARITEIVGVMVFAILVAASVGISIFQKRLDIILLMLMILLSKAMEAKIPCKEGKQRVQ